MGCIAGEVVALRARKPGSHVKSNRTARDGLRFLLIISIGSREAINARSQAKRPPPSPRKVRKTAAPTSGRRSRSVHAPGSSQGSRLDITTAEQRGLYTRKNQTTRHNRGTGQQAHENDTHTVGLRHTRMKENIPTPARADQLGDGKVTKLWHKAAAPIPGLGCNYIARTTAAFNGPGPSEFTPRPRVSVFMCWPALVNQILLRSSPTDLGD